jgi:DNA-binding MurR/RpiR family transcriptional regulator
MDTGWLQAMNTSALCTSIIALTAMVASPTAQAADTTLTLACQGTTISGMEDAKPEPISMGIIVNFTKRTVQGFAYPVKITDVND